MLTNALKDLFQNPADLPQLQFRFSEFLAIDPRIDRIITFELERFKPLLKEKIQQLTVFRYVEALKDHQEVVDPDYKPSQGSQES
jgi:hypothetical protein